MLPSLFISHGSPMLALHPGASGPALTGLANALAQPKAIVVVSAHWESRELVVTGSKQPETWHDFHGFPRRCTPCSTQHPASLHWPNRCVRYWALLACRHVPIRTAPSTMAPGYR